MDAQAWSPDDYARNASFVPKLGEPLLELLTVPAPARVLDLGCGDGALTSELCARGYDVLGVDSSPEMVRAARARGLSAEVADGHALPFDSEFDAVFSNAALHWLLRPDDAIASVHRALRPGGQFVAELGGAGNIARLLSALTSLLDARGVAGAGVVPWYFPSAGEYATRLERAGFRVDLLAHFERPTVLPGDVLGWLATFGDSFTNALPVAERPAYLEDVRERLSQQLVNRDGHWVLDYVRLRFRAVKC